MSVCVLLGSCVEKNVFNAFDKVERYMDVYSDSALLLLEQIVLGVERFFCQFEYRVRYVEPLFLFPVDVWRDLGESCV